jgi:hypothetical protein
MYLRVEWLPSKALGLIPQHHKNKKYLKPPFFWNIVGTTAVFPSTGNKDMPLCPVILHLLSRLPSSLKRESDLSNVIQKVDIFVRAKNKHVFWLQIFSKRSSITCM